MEEERILETLCRCGPCTIDEIASKLPEMELPRIRRILSELVRQGKVVKQPDYSKNKLVFIAKNEICP